MGNRTILESERLKLRYFDLNDLDKVFKMSQEEGIKKWLPDQFYQNKEEAAEVLSFLTDAYSEIDPHQKPLVLGIEIKSNKQLIGHIGLSTIEGMIEIGYAVEEKYQGSGYATEAVKELSTWALKNLDLEKIWGIVEKENLASARVLEKAGYYFVESQCNKKKDYYKFV